MRVLIYISWPVKAWCSPDTHVARLRKQFPDIEFIQPSSLDGVEDVIGEINVAFTPSLTTDLVVAGRKLEWVHSSAAAVEGLLPLGDLASRGIPVTNSRGVQAIPIAEHVMGGLLVLARKYDRAIEAQRERRWIQNDLIHDWPWLLHGKRMTIVGLGTIGLEVAKRAHAFGMNITGVRRRMNEHHHSYLDRVLTADRLHEGLEKCDILVLAAPGVTATQGMIGAQQLAMLIRGAILVNVARAQIVDDAAMRAALESGQLGGAVLDVFEREPLEPENPLWSTPNVIVTPHSSGFRASHWDEVTELFAQNLRHFIGGEPLKNIVDHAAGY
jgi:phosphoglycerate dehydrogenase-like enzyme